VRADEHAAREEARRLEAENPLWIVIFGVSSREFVCFPRFGLNGGGIVAAKDPGTLLHRMRTVERSALATSDTPTSPAHPPSR
jgi:hypothetical protein